QQYKTANTRSNILAILNPINESLILFFAKQTLMPAFMFLSQSGQRVDARDYLKATNDPESTKFGRDILQGF
ncbi:hypothetical protein, partial [Klebsiella michiganensis]|uniref:hypothetical protein n=1 Tax=Klebsiella michiganensis TaxID=1134687 RepID=UPI0025A03777